MIPYCNLQLLGRDSAYIIITHPLSSIYAQSSCVPLATRCLVHHRIPVACQSAPQATSGWSSCQDPVLTVGLESAGLHYMVANHQGYRPKLGSGYHLGIILGLHHAALCPSDMVWAFCTQYVRTCGGHGTSQG